jgi:hypothetical protein
MLYRKQIFVFAISFMAAAFFILANAELGYSGEMMVVTGACCSPDGSCEEVPQGICEDSYQGDFTTCDPNPCPQPTGACCPPHGSCEEVPQGMCEGNYQGDGTSCEEHSCDPGACCFGDGTCDDTLNQFSCEDEKGGYKGPGTQCEANTCKAECPAPEALKCYKVKDLDASYNEGSIQNLVVQLTGIFQFGEETCKIVGNYREFCFPVDVQIEKEEKLLDAVDSGLIDPRVDRVCYEIRNCDESKADIPDAVTIHDGVGGTRKIVFKEGRRPPAPSTLCMPAEKCDEDCVKDGDGADCTLEVGSSTVDGTCHGDCRCVPGPTGPTGCCLSENSCDQVTEQDCPDDAEHEFIANGNCTGLQCAVEIP